MKATSLVLLALCLFSSDARSQSPFDGTWIIGAGKNENLASEKPRVLSVADGVFREGDRHIKADGSDQKVPATGYWDTVSVRIVDDRTVEIISKKAGKPMYTERDTVSADGNTLTKVMKDTTEAEAVTFESDFRRRACSCGCPRRIRLVAGLQAEPIGEQYDHQIQMHIAGIQRRDSFGRKARSQV
jgi:hypothetical protein